MKAASVLLVMALFSTASAQAQTASPGSQRPSHHAQAPASGAQPTMADGEVRKIDKEQGKITLRHGPIASLDMPSMTMVFKVADPKVLGGFKEGDKIKFAAQKVDGSIIVTAIEPAAK